MDSILGKQMGPASVDDGLNKELMSVKTHTIILLLHALAIHFFGFFTVPRGKFLFWLI